MSAVMTHRPEPMPWRAVAGDPWTLTRTLVCRFCERPVQRRGVLRRWKHVA